MSLQVVGETGTGVRQGQIVSHHAGNSGLWREMTKDQVRDFISGVPIGTVSELKQAQYWLVT